jgi:hypothetical protein
LVRPNGEFTFARIGEVKTATARKIKDVAGYPPTECDDFAADFFERFVVESD